VPWIIYANVNMHAPLPMPLAPGETPVLLTIYVGDGLAAHEDRVERTQLRLLMSGVEKNAAVQVKLNGILLESPTVHSNGWRILETSPSHFAEGRNLVYIRLPGAKRPAVIEKLQVHVAYRQ